MSKIKVFISYSHEDLRIVIPIISIIRMMSEKVFRDIDNIRPGDKWEISIENALEQCEKMIDILHHIVRSFAQSAKD